MNRIAVNLVYLADSPDMSQQPVEASLLSVPRVGDCFQHPYGKGKRYVVRAVVHEADQDAAAVFVELGVA
jgi:hypothetical protein